MTERTKYLRLSEPCRTQFPDVEARFHERAARTLRPTRDVPTNDLTLWHASFF